MKTLLLSLLLATPLLCTAQLAPVTPLATSSPAPAAPLAMPASSADSSEQLRLKLQLTPEQDPLWQQYMASIEAYTQQFYRERPALPSEDEPAPQQITRLVMNQQNRLSRLEDIEQSAKALYASLDSDQKKVANQWLLPNIPTFTGPPPNSTGATERRSDIRPGGEMRRRGGGMGSGRF